MLIECGFIEAEADDGRVYSFTPSFRKISSIGNPHEIVASYADLFGPNAEAQAAYVLACLCDQDDASPLIGCWEHELGRTAGEMPEWLMVLLARDLMRHGIVGKARPEVAGDGKFSERFDVSEYISAARVHLGLSTADAEALSMTEFQTLFEMKFPKAGSGKRDVPTREEYAAGLAAIAEKRRG